MIMSKTRVAAAGRFKDRQDVNSACRRPVLPDDLAPALVERVERLLAEVATTSAPPISVDQSYRGPRCIVCHQGGKLGGHHDEAGQIQWIHRTCHRRLHRRGQIGQAEMARIVAASVRGFLREVASALREPGPVAEVDHAAVKAPLVDQLEVDPNSIG